MRGLINNQPVATSKPYMLVMARFMHYGFVVGVVHAFDTLHALMLIPAAKLGHPSSGDMGS